VKALEHSMNDLSSKKIDALVTAPIDKSQLISAGFKFPGHTEYIASKSKGKPLMLMIHENIKVALVTGHIGVNEIAKQLNTELILEKLSTLHDSLRMDFSISKPKIAVLGLNPHAGDQGKFGKEEEEIIQPALTKAKQQNMLVFGPFPADGFFASGNFQKYDAILAMYHDQGLAAFKALAFNDGVNYTAGLPIVRTSPDHGTAFDIAGKGKASANSMRQAIYTAMDIYRSRINYRELTSNPLQSQVKEKDKRRGSGEIE
jgi:4-hydroxythreonine-4-phosphate dehydrogenase